jgi:hypothetical protein
MHCERFLLHLFLGVDGHVLHFQRFTVDGWPLHQHAQFLVKSLQMAAISTTSLMRLSHVGHVLPEILDSDRTLIRDAEVPFDVLHYLLCLRARAHELCLGEAAEHLQIDILWLWLIQVLL